MKEPAQARSRDRVRTYQALPWGRARGWAPLSLDANDLSTQKLGLNRRLCRLCPPPKPGFAAEFAEFVLAWCRRHLQPLKTLPTFEEWLSTTPYTEARREELRQKYDRLKGAMPTLRQSSQIDSFIKRESYLEHKAPRWINSRCDTFKAWSGRYFAAIEKEVFALPWFIKHVPVPDRAGLISALRKAGLKYYENDYKAFESSFVPETIRSCEGVLYQYMLGGTDPAAAAHIVRVLSGTNRLRTRAGLKVKIQGGRMSGDMCTSLGNGFTNLMLVSYIVHKKLGSYDGLGALVEGDDGLFASPVSLTASDFADCGFTAEIKELDDPMDGHFVGMTTARDGTLLKDPHKVLAGFGWTSSFIGHGEKVGLELLRAKALSLAYEMPQCPIVGQLALSALARTNGVQPRWTDSWKEKHTAATGATEFAPSPMARARFAQLYGISVQQQIEAELLIRNDSLNELIHVFSPPGDVSAYADRYLEVSG